MTKRFLSILFLLIPVVAVSGERPSRPDVPRQKDAPPPASAFDTGYAWDQFRHHGRLMWTCRDIKTGKVVANELCEFKERTDTQWPGKDTPPSWIGVLH